MVKGKGLAIGTLAGAILTLGLVVGVQFVGWMHNVGDGSICQGAKCHDFTFDAKFGAWDLDISVTMEGFTIHHSDAYSKVSAPFSAIVVGWATIAAGLAAAGSALFAGLALAGARTRLAAAGCGVVAFLAMGLSIACLMMSAFSTDVSNGGTQDIADDVYTGSITFKPVSPDLGVFLAAGAAITAAVTAIIGFFPVPKPAPRPEDLLPPGMEGTPLVAGKPAYLVDARQWKQPLATSTSEVKTTSTGSPAVKSFAQKPAAKPVTAGGRPDVRSVTTPRR